MLGKLWKHEWKSTWKVGGMLLLGLVLVSFFGWLSFQAPLWQAAANNTNYSSFGVWDLLSFGTLFMYVIMLIGLHYGIIIYMGVRFYKTMYTDEGYLTHTLPVSKHQILMSKILNSGVWMLLMEVGIFLSVMVLMLSMIGVFVEGHSWADLWNNVMENIDYVDELFMMVFGMRMSSYFWMLLVFSLVMPFCSITVLFGAISMGQLFAKHRVLMAIVSYVGIMIVANIISSTIQSIVSINQMSRQITDSSLVGGYMNVTMCITGIISLVEAAALYWISYYVTSKKLNME